MEPNIETLQGTIDGLTELVYSLFITLPLRQREQLRSALQQQMFDMETLPANQPAIPLRKVQSNAVLQGAHSFLVALKVHEQNEKPGRAG